MKWIAFVFVSLFAAHAQAGTIWCLGKLDYQGKSHDLSVKFPSGGADGPVQISDITGNGESWLVYNVAGYELISGGRAARVTLALDADASGLGAVNPEDWAMAFEIDFHMSRDPDSLHYFQGKLGGEPVGPIGLVCDPQDFAGTAGIRR